MAGHIPTDNSPEDEGCLLSAAPDKLGNPFSDDRHLVQYVQVLESEFQSTVASSTKPPNALVTTGPVPLEVRQNNPQDCSNLIRAEIDRATVEISRTIIALNATFSQQLQQASISASNGIKSAQDSATSMVAVVSQSASIATSSAFSSVTVAQRAVTSANAAVESVSSASSSDVSRLSESLNSLQANLDSVQASASSALSAAQSALESANVPVPSLAAPPNPQGQPMSMDQSMSAFSPGKNILLSPGQVAALVLGDTFGSVLLTLAAMLYFMRMRKKDRDSYLEDQNTSRSPKKLPARLSSAIRTGNSMVIRFNPRSSTDTPPVPSRSDSSQSTSSLTASSHSEKRETGRTDNTPFRNSTDDSTIPKAKRRSTNRSSRKQSSTVLISEKPPRLSPPNLSPILDERESIGTALSIAEASNANQWPLRPDQSMDNFQRVYSLDHAQSLSKVEHERMSGAEIAMDPFSDMMEIRPRYSTKDSVEDEVPVPAAANNAPEFSSIDFIADREMGRTSIGEREDPYTSNRENIEDHRVSFKVLNKIPFESSQEEDHAQSARSSRTRPMSILSETDESSLIDIFPMVPSNNTRSHPITRDSDASETKDFSTLSSHYEPVVSPRSIYEQPFKEETSMPRNAAYNAGVHVDAHAATPTPDQTPLEDSAYEEHRTPSPLSTTLDFAMTSALPQSDLGSKPEDPQLIEPRTNHALLKPTEQANNDDTREARGRSMLRTSDIIEARQSAILRLKEGRAQPNPTPTPAKQPSPPPTNQMNRTLSPLQRNPVTETETSLIQALSTSTAPSPSLPRHTSPLRRNPVTQHPTTTNTTYQTFQPPNRNPKKDPRSSFSFSQAMSKFQSLATQNPQDVFKAASEVNSRAIAGIYIPGSLREQAVRNVSRSRERGDGRGVRGEERDL